MSAEPAEQANLVPRKWPYDWDALRGLYPPEVILLPKAAGGSDRTPGYPEVHRKIATRLATIAAEPWGPWLAVACAVMLGQRRQVNSVWSFLSTAAPCFRRIFEGLKLTSSAGWDADAHMRRYLSGEIAPGDSPRTRLGFWRFYTYGANSVYAWAESQRPADAERVAPYLLPKIDPKVGLAINGKAIEEQTQEHRKAETDAIVARYPQIRSTAHRRFGRVVRLHAVYSAAVDAVLADPAGAKFPVELTYDEGADDGVGRPATERLGFRLWTRESFVGAHPDAYKRETVAITVRAARRKTRLRREDILLEFVGSEPLGGPAGEGLWFAELVRRSVFGRPATMGTVEDLAEKQRWLRAWGYGSDKNPEARVSPFLVPTLPGSIHNAQWASRASKKTGVVFVHIDHILVVAAFGVCATDVFTTTGMRMNELLQVHLSEPCLSIVRQGPAPGAKKAPRMRLVLRLIPKGEGEDKPQEFFVGKETARLLGKVAEIVRKHYGLPEGRALPSVAFSPKHGRANRFGRAPYLLQIGHRHLDADEVSSCMRFILHGMVFRDRTGRIVVVKSHLLRHGFATHAVQVERVPIDIVALWLHQRDVRVTAYYGAVTPSMAAEAHDEVLTRFATHVDYGELLRRSPPEIRKQLEEAQRRSGTLMRVKGGECTSHAFCPHQFACIGCSANATDPEQRAEVEQERAFAVKQRQSAVEEGFVAEVERYDKAIRDCDTKLEEMDLIEAYRRDEERDVDFTVGGLALRTDLAGTFGLRTEAEADG